MHRRSGSVLATFSGLMCAAALQLCWVSAGARPAVAAACIAPGANAQCRRDDQCCAGSVCAGVCRRGCKIDAVLRVNGRTLISKAFYPNGAINPDNECQWCQAAINRLGWTSRAAGTACGSSSVSDCDNADTCDGSGSCQVNHKADGTGCTADTNECTKDLCANGVCTHPNEPVGTTCGSSGVSDCDNADTCDGSGSCQVNHKADGTGCTADTNECTKDVCASGVCTHPNEPVDTTCGSSSASVCDNADTCDGSGRCQVNHVADGATCNDGVAGSCCNGSCAHDQCCNGNASSCNSPPEANMTATCSGSSCVYDCTPGFGPTVCENPFVTKALPPLSVLLNNGTLNTCLDLSNQTTVVPCLLCRESASDPSINALYSCTDNSQCCGLCVQDPSGSGFSYCQTGLVRSPCSSNADCFSGVCDASTHKCTAPPTLGSPCCDPTGNPTAPECNNSNILPDNCPAGVIVNGSWGTMSCGHVVGNQLHTFCCHELDSPCSTDADCCYELQQEGSPGNACVLGTCKKRQGQDALCGKDNDCDNFHTCIGGTCQPKSTLNGQCDSNADCCDTSTFPAGVGCGVTYQCSSASSSALGTCKAPNGAACPTDSSGQRQPASCALGQCVQCGSGPSDWICGNCCNSPGKDFFFCGEDYLFSCCNHQCVNFIDDTNCGACGIDCTCGGTDPDRKCARTNLMDNACACDTTTNPNCHSDFLPCTTAVCSGTYSPTSGHCQSSSFSLSASERVCASGTDCPTPPTCSCSSPFGLFCFASCTGAFPDLTVNGYCGDTGETCFAGDDTTCCNKSDVCQEISTCFLVCSGGTDYQCQPGDRNGRCVGATNPFPCCTDYGKGTCDQ
jgi:hypothetical protein